jgi:hypothetical protein
LILSRTELEYKIEVLFGVFAIDLFCANPLNIKTEQKHKAKKYFITFIIE